jgi:hypothetical protein
MAERDGSYFLKIHFNIVLPTTSRSSKLYLSFLIYHQSLYSYAFLFSIRATFPTYLSLVYLIILIEIFNGSKINYLIHVTVDCLLL